MIDKVKSVESLLESIDRINKGISEERVFNLVLNNGMKLKCPLPELSSSSHYLQLIEGEKRERKNG